MPQSSRSEHFKWLKPIGCPNPGTVTKNETWIEDKDEEPLTPEQFKERMVLDSISIDSDGDVSFYHSDGDLFWGHCILVTMNSENNFTSADIAG